MEDIKWSVGKANGKSVSPSVEKIEYVPLMRNSKDSTDAEKETVRLWNLMNTTLRDHGLMKEKGE